ncbi:hypothetical protein BKA81DRAFT_411540 [Phyllosticta paracitricarpa]|uniref:DUF6590 domain-containing protein n=1 Tax=Phyllosticta citricarpa TaxID=55181 RepID=A0ABR1MP22_9PEZI
MAHLNRPIFPTAAAYLQSLAMVEPAVSESERPNGVHGGIPREPPEGLFLALPLLCSDDQLLMTEPDLPLYLVKPSDREEFFCVGKIFNERSNARARAPAARSSKPSPSGRMMRKSPPTASSRTLSKTTPHACTITANRREPPGSRGIIHTTPYPPDPLAGEANLLDHVFAAKPLQAPYDLPRTARVDYTTIFNARHDAPVRHIAQLDEESLDVLCRNFREATGGCLIGAVKKETSKKKAEVVDEGDEVD